MKKYRLPDDFIDLFRCLSAAKCEFVLVGAYAMAAWGYIRTTGDIDVFINSTEENASRVWKALRNFGAPLGTLREGDLSKPCTIFQMGVPPLRIDILTSIDGVEFKDLRGHIRKSNVFGEPLPILSPQKLLKISWPLGALKIKLMLPNSEKSLKRGNGRYEARRGYASVAFCED